MRVLIAPDKFKGTLTAQQVAEAMATGWRRSRPEDELVEVPMADGGEGTLEALVSALGGERHSARITGPLGDPVDASYGVAPRAAGGGLVAVVEMALASGLELISERSRDPKMTTTKGTGELILAAAGPGVAEMIVCIGGSATNDGGAGMAEALGVKLLDSAGLQIGPGGEQLLLLAAIDVSGLEPRLRNIRFTVACDVDNPLVGPQGAAAVYGPQKGASPDDVLLLDRALGHYAAILQRDLGIDLREVPGAGAAGGLGAGLIAFLGARLRPGIEVVMEAVRLHDRLLEADLVLTGEGSFDSQSLHGKTAMGVVGAAREAGKKVAVLCGTSAIEPADLFVSSLTGRFGADRALGQARAALIDLSAEVAADWENSG